MAEKTVMNFAELKAAIEDADTTLVTLGADVVFSGGIRVPTAKKTLLIDGGGHTVTDNNSSAYTDTIYVAAGAGNTSVTMKNVVWSGRNYYGVVCVYDDSANAGVTVTLDGVTYTGPQAVYNRYGTTIAKNCTFSVEKNGASASAQEFAEANRLIFSGKVDVTVATSSNAAIWFPFSGAAFTVQPDAVVTINAPNTYVFYTDGAAKPVFHFGKNSQTRFYTKNGLFYAAGTGAHIASSVTVESGALLYATVTANNGVPLFKCAGNFVAEHGASVFLNMPTRGSSPLLYFSTAAKTSFESPKNVVLYSNGGKVFSFAAGSAATPNTINLTAEQINYWTAAKTPFGSAGGFDDPPLLSYRKADGSDAAITQTATSSAVVTTTSNLVAGDTGYPVGSGFDLTKAAVLSLGTLTVTVDRLTDLSEAVTGTTAPNAAVEYSDSEQSASGTADTDGNFSIPLDQKPNVGNTATIKANADFLTSSVAVTVSGSVSVTGITDIPFNAFVAPLESTAVERIDPDWRLELTDTRPGGGKWTLYLTLASPLTSGENSIENAVTFTDTETSVLDAEPLAVASGISEGAGVFTVGWEKSKGVLLALEPEKLYEKGNYSSRLTWHVEFE